MKGWLVPAYPMADDLAEMTLQRIVVRAGLSHDLATALLHDIDSEVAFLDALDSPMRGRAAHTSTIERFIQVLKCWWSQ